MCLALRRRKIWDNPHGAPTPLHESRCAGNTTKGPQPGFVSFICLHKPASPPFSPLSEVVPWWASAAWLTVWGYVGKFCVSCISLGGLVNNHTIHGMFRHKAPCRASFGSAAARNIFFNFLARKNPAAAPLVSRYALLWRRSCISTAGTRPARPLPPTS